jgi:hypothetical protein
MSRKATLDLKRSTPFGLLRAQPAIASGSCRRSLRSRVGCPIGATAWRLRRREFHKFYSCTIRIIDVHRPFAVTTDFRLIGVLESMSVNECQGSFGTRDAEREMVLNT